MRCTRCNESKPLDQFGVYTDKSYDPPVVRRLSQCRACRSKMARAWNLANTERAKSSRDLYNRNERTQRRRKAHHFGITEVTLAAMESAQQGHCAICQRFVGKLVVDHNHQTGEVRGLLCSHCNLGLGAFADDPMRLLVAIRYLYRNRDGHATQQNYQRPDRPAGSLPRQPAAWRRRGDS